MEEPAIDWPLFAHALSLFCGLVVLVLYAWYPHARTHPSQFVFWQSFYESFLSLIHIIFFSQNDLGGTVDCSIFGPIVLFCLQSSLSWYALMAVDLFVSIRNPFIFSETYLPLYHCLTILLCGVWSGALIFSGATLTLRKDLGTCWAAPISAIGERVNWVFIFTPIFLAVFISLGVLVYATFRLICRYRNETTFAFHMKYITKMTCFTFAFTAYWIIAAVLYATITSQITEPDSLALVFPLLFSARGTLLAVTWIWNQDICSPVVYQNTEQESEKMKYADITQALRAEVMPFLLAGIRGREEEQQDEVDIEERGGGHPYSVDEQERSVSSLTLKLFSASERPALTIEAEHARRRMKITIHQEVLFRRIRGLLDVNVSEIHGIREEKSKDGGRTDSFLYFTDEEPPGFIFKTITQIERGVLDEILEDYYQHLLMNPSSLLPKIVGCYSIRFEAQLITFMLMKNILCTPKKIHQMFDLKGSSVDRTVTDPNKNVLKDNNLQSKILLLPEHRKMFLEQIERDTEFLRSKQIMDYSLLLGVHKSFVQVPILDSNNDNDGSNKFLDGVQALQVEGPSFFIFGLVDILQKWVLKKKFELLVKTRFMRKDRNGLSAQEPRFYKDRFCKAMSMYTEPQEVVESPSRLGSFGTAATKGRWGSSARAEVLTITPPSVTRPHRMASSSSSSFSRGSCDGGHEGKLNNCNSSSSFGRIHRGSCDGVHAEKPNCNSSNSSNSNGNLNGSNGMSSSLDVSASGNCKNVDSKSHDDNVNSGKSIAGACVKSSHSYGSLADGGYSSSG